MCDYPRVSQILADMSLIDVRWYTDASALRGKRVHEAFRIVCAGYDLSIDWLTRHRELNGYLDGIYKLRREHEIVVEGAEQEVIHETEKYIGHPDMWGLFDGKKTVPELKTGFFPNWAPLQDSAYAVAL